MSQSGPADPDAAVAAGVDAFDLARSMTPTFRRLELTNFLSYKSASVDFGRFIALVGPNASGKSNAVSAIRLLREIAIYGLPIALARRGGFDQLRHRSAGRPNDPALRLTFAFEGQGESSYELKFGAVRGGRYRVKEETALVWFHGSHFTMKSDGERVEWVDHFHQHEDPRPPSGSFAVAPGQSALSSGGTAGHLVFDALQTMRTVEVNPAKVADLQEPSSTREFESDGSNVVSVYENLPAEDKRALVDELAAIVPGIVSIEVVRLADRQTLRLKQSTESGNREFYAKQMSDGTLRALAILLAVRQQATHGLLVIEEPEVAIHLGALRTLVELLEAESHRLQVVITTHSADIVDALPLDALRVVWSQGDASHVAPISEHSKEPVRLGLITPGELLRSDALDPAV